jgi:hypothetical protein
MAETKKVKSVPSWAQTERRRERLERCNTTTHCDEIHYKTKEVFQSQ